MRKSIRLSVFPLALAFILCLLIPITANATGVSFEPLNRDKESWGYVPEGVAIRTGTIPIVRATKGGPFLIEPSESSNIAFFQSDEYCVRYLGTVEGYYKALSFDGIKVVYIAKANAELGKVQAQFAARPASTYQVVAVPAVQVKEAVSDDGLSVSATISVDPSAPGVAEEDFNMKTQLRPGSYYIKAEKGKTATVALSEDQAGKKVLETANFTDGKIMLVEKGQYLTVKYGEIMTPYMAPKAKVEEWLKEYPKNITVLEGFPFNPEMEYAWTDEALMITLK